MRVGCTFRLPGGELRELVGGELIGRSWNAALRLTDPRVSEAHAMVSLRGGALRLLALRGRFAVDGVTLQDVELRPGLVIWLTRALSLEVVDVVLPSEVLAVEGDGLARHVLAGVCALRADPRPTLTLGFASDAAATIWHDGLGWVIRGAEGDDQPLVAGDVWEIGGHTFRAVAVRVEQAGHSVTGAGAIEAPLTIVARYDTVHVQRGDAPPVVLTGNAARLVSDLAAVGLPIAWESAARDLWRDEADSVALRRRWDANIARLRQKLREARVRADLVRADGCGNFELFLHAGDRVQDET